MMYSSVTFIFFLLFGLLVFYFIPVKLRVGWLIILSILWYASWDPLWLISFLFLMSVNYVLLRAGPKGPVLYAGLIILNAIFFFIGKGSSYLGIKEPSGISFFVFLNLSIILDYFRSNQASFHLRFQEFLLLPIYFPLMMGGPLERGQKLFPQLNDDQSFSWLRFIDGILIFTLGYLKAEVLSPAVDYALGGSTAILLTGFLGTLKAYFVFSGFCDMGRGVSQLFGISLSINFRPFYFSKHPNDFWQRWNITLGTWIRDYVSFPMLLKYGRKINQNLLLAFSFILVGLWHGLTFKWLIFGLFNAAIIVSYNLLRARLPQTWLGYVFAYAIIIGNGAILADNPAASHPFKWSWDPLFSLPLILSFLAIMFVEVIQEKRDKIDWYLSSPTWIKSAIVILAVLLFFYQVDSSAQIRRGQIRPVPEYFKI